MFPTSLPRSRSGPLKIKVLLMDVDGTMTDGSVTLLSQSDGTALEIKTFDAHDGQGLTLPQTAGLRTGCITGRESAALLCRAHEMKMEFIYMKQPIKMPNSPGTKQFVMMQPSPKTVGIYHHTHTRGPSCLLTSAPQDSECNRLWVLKKSVSENAG